LILGLYIFGPVRYTWPKMPAAPVRPISPEDTMAVDTRIKEHIQESARTAGMSGLVPKAKQIDSPILKIEIPNLIEKSEWQAWVEKYNEIIDEIPADIISKWAKWMIFECIPWIKNLRRKYIAIDILTGLYCVNESKHECLVNLRTEVYHRKIFVIYVGDDADNRVGRK
jgi:hypothetical protein